MELCKRKNKQTKTSTAKNKQINKQTKNINNEKQTDKQKKKNRQTKGNNRYATVTAQEPYTHMLYR